MVPYFERFVGSETETSVRNNANKSSAVTSIQTPKATLAVRRNRGANQILVAEFDNYKA